MINSKIKKKIRDYIQPTSDISDHLRLSEALKLLQNTIEGKYLALDYAEHVYEIGSFIFGRDNRLKKSLSFARKFLSNSISVDSLVEIDRQGFLSLHLLQLRRDRAIDCGVDKELQIASIKDFELASTIITAWVICCGDRLFGLGFKHAPPRQKILDVAMKARKLLPTNEESPNEQNQEKELTWQLEKILLLIE